MAAYWEKAAHSGYDMFSKYHMYLTANLFIYFFFLLLSFFFFLFFFHLGFWSGILFSDCAFSR